MRNKRLDILRRIAVLLVIILHGNISSFFLRVGWTGVDLFFVLSGFLISGLLFSEYKKRGSISFKKVLHPPRVEDLSRVLRLFVRYRLISHITLHTTAPLVRYLHEIFFVQNYWYGVWDHTWTLGVEEQFYVFLPVLLLFLVRISSNQRQPFRAIPWIILFAAVLCMTSRTASVYRGIPNYLRAYTATHDRIDSLFMGVLLGYLYHFRPLVLEHLTRPTVNRMATNGRCGDRYRQS